MERPERIYLQRPESVSEWEGSTWCQDKINDEDVEYIRFDLLEAQVAKYKGALEEIRVDNMSCAFMHAEIKTCACQRMMKTAVKTLEE